LSREFSLLGILLFTTGIVGTPAAKASAAAANLLPASTVEVAIAAGATSQFTVDLPAGTAAQLRLIQRSEFVDLELRDGAGGDIRLRTESGIGGLAETTLLASTSLHWSISLATRSGHGASTATLILGPAHPAAAADAWRSSAFAHFAAAELLRYANVKESRVTAQSAEADLKTRDEYSAAAADYAAGGDGCGQQRALIGRARLEVGRGNYAAGRSFADGALAIVCEGGPAERAQALKTVGMAAAYLGDYAGSAEAAEQAAALYQQTGDLRYQGIVLGNLSDVYMQLGETNRALTAATGALHAAQGSDDSQGIVFSRKSIAAAHLARGELAAALSDYRLALGDLSVTPYPMIQGETWNDLGILYHRMGDYGQSLQAYAAAQKVWETMRNHAGHADTLINQAEALLESDNIPGALHDFNEALQIARADGLKGVEAGALRGQGAAYVKRGDLRDARRLFLQSLELARSTKGSAAESYALRAVAEVDYREGHLSEARRNAELALRQARQAVDRDAEAATLELLARVVAGAGELTQARTLIDQALDIVEQQRGQINDPSLRTSYFASMRAYPDTQIDILMRLHARFPNQGYDEAALAAAERARARSLQDMLAEKSIDLARGLDPRIADEQRDAEDRLNAAAVQFARAGKARDDRRHALAAEVDAASRALDEVRGRIRADNPHYADLLRPADLRVKDLQQQSLDANTGILEYWLGSRASYLWIVDRQSLRVVRLPPRAAIERISARLQSLCRAGSRHTPAGGFDQIAAAASQHNEAIRQSAAALGRAVLPANIRRALPVSIAVVADAGLEGAPFGLLPASSSGETLGATHDVVYLPSIAMLQAIRRHAGDGGREVLAIIAAPQIDTPEFPDLPYARKEALAIAALLPKEQVWSAVGASASRAAVMSADWRRFTTIHFAAHAVVDRNRPALSGIVLSPPASGGTAQDGVLRLNDIYGLDMPARLVVLSGCETAAGRGLDSEGVFSLARAFFYAGSTRVLASLWPVDDRATAEFMRAFYQSLLVEHSTAASALRVAQRRLSADDRWASPYYWAGFVLQGDWD
jgi:CHAT domain-containing protein/Flp pilus assembly protein TadD